MRTIIIALGLFDLTLIATIILHRFLLFRLSTLRDENYLVCMRTIEAALASGEVSQRPPSLSSASERATAEEAFLDRYRSATPEERRILQSLFQAWGLDKANQNGLQRGNKWNQAWSALVLGQMQLPKSATGLIRLIELGQGEAKIAALGALSLLEEPAEIDTLIWFLAQPGARCSRLVLPALIRSGQSAPERLLPHLKHHVALVRRSVAAALAEIASDREAFDLIQAASDPEPEVRGQVARALGRVHHPLGFEVIKRLAADKIWHVRLRAIDALAKVQVSEARDLLFYAMRDENWQVRRKAAGALCKSTVDPIDLFRRVRDQILPDRNALEALIDALERQGTTWQAIDCICSPLPAVRERSETLAIEMLRAGKFECVLYALEAHPDLSVRRRLQQLINEHADASVKPSLHRLLETHQLNGEARRSIETILEKYQD